MPSKELRILHVAPDSVMKVLGVKCDFNPLDKKLCSVTNTITLTNLERYQRFRSQVSTYYNINIP
jgi:hypothetical protein